MGHKNRNCIKTFKGHENRVRSVDFNYDGSLLVSGDSVGNIIIWDINKMKKIREFRTIDTQIRQVKFNQTGDFIASGSDDGRTRIWRVETGKVEKVLLATRPYEGINITDVTGISKAQVTSLKELGAID